MFDKHIQKKCYRKGYIILRFRKANIIIAYIFTARKIKYNQIFPQNFQPHSVLLKRALFTPTTIMVITSAQLPLLLSLTRCLYFKQKLNVRPYTRLPITFTRNRGQEKESMRGAYGFAEVELKLSTNAARCEGLSSKTFI